MATTRKIDIFSIEAVPVTRTSRDKDLWDRHGTRHDWLMRSDYSHMSVRVTGMRVRYGKREVRQSFRIAMVNSVTAETLASRTFCMPVPAGERDCEAIVELPLSLAKPESGVIYLVEVHSLDAEATTPLCSVPMRFFDLASQGLLPTNIYKPCGGWFVERGEDDKPLPSSPHYVELPQVYSHMTVRFSSPLSLAPIQMPEIRVRFYFLEYRKRRLESVLDLKGVPPTPPYNLSDNRFEATFAIPAHCGEIFWIEFETLGHVFANVMGRCRVMELEGELFADCFEFGPVDPETIADASKVNHWNKKLDERARELSEGYKPAPADYREDGVGRWDDIDVDDMLQDFIDSQIMSEEEEEESGTYDRLAAERESITELPIPEFPAAPDGMEGLRSMIGLAEVKDRVEATAKTMRFFGLRRDKSLKIKPVSLHSLFLGSPGTGKTTVARHMGAIMKEAGALSSGHVVETERAKLIGQYYSSTHENTLKAIEEARGGILLIDEAYQLHAPDDPRDPGHDVLDTLMTLLADESERDIMVILAGYPSKTLELLTLNPGLRSRFPESNRYYFEDYTPAELLTIAEEWFLREEYVLTPEARFRLAERLERDWRRHDESFGNARHVINIIEKEVIPAMADRVLAMADPDEEALMTILLEDIPY